MNIELITEKTRYTRECRKCKEARTKFLRQKCKIQWLTQGDLNTKLFHSMLKARRNANRIFTVEDPTEKSRSDITGITTTYELEEHI